MAILSSAVHILSGGISTLTTVGGWAFCCPGCDQPEKLRTVRMSKNRRIVVAATATIVLRGAVWRGGTFWRRGCATLIGAAAESVVPLEFQAEGEPSDHYGGFPS